MSLRSTEVCTFKHSLKDPACSGAIMARLTAYHPCQYLFPRQPTLQKDLVSRPQTLWCLLLCQGGLEALIRATLSTLCFPSPIHPSVFQLSMYIPPSLPQLWQTSTAPPVPATQVLKLNIECLQPNTYKDSTVHTKSWQPWLGRGITEEMVKRLWCFALSTSIIG